MLRSKTVWVIIVVILIATGCWAAWHSAQVQKEQKQAREFKAGVETEIQKIIHDLKVSPEQIYSDSRTDWQIGKLRLESFRKQGIEKVMPYCNQVRPHSFTANGSPWIPVEVYTEKNRDRLSYKFPHQACSHLVRAFNNPAPNYREYHYNQYLKQNPEIFEKQIRPSLMLWVDSTSHISTPLKACEALICWGDRSEKIRARLTKMVKAGYDDADKAAALLKKCGWPVPKPWTLSQVPVYTSSQKPRTDSQGNPLPAGALRRIGQLNLRHSGKDDELALPKNGLRLASVGSPNSHSIYAMSTFPDPPELFDVDIHTGRIRRIKIPCEGKPKKIAVCPNKKLIATYCYIPYVKGKETPRSAKYQLAIWDISTGKCLAEMLKDEYPRIQALGFDPYRPRLFVRSELYSNSYTEVHDTATLKVLYRLTDFWVFRLFPRGKHLAFVGKGPGSSLFAWSEFMPLAKREFNPTVSIGEVMLSPSGDRAVTLSPSSKPRVIRVWNTKDLWADKSSKKQKLSNPQIGPARKLKICRSDLYNHSISSAILTPDCKFILTSHSRLPGLYVWDMEGNPIGRIVGLGGSLRFVGDKLVSAHSNATLLVWDWPAIRKWCEERAKAAKQSAATLPATKKAG